MKKIKSVSPCIIIGVLAFLSASAGAQTLATGDSQTVTQPTYPAVCITANCPIHQFATFIAANFR